MMQRRDTAVPNVLFFGEQEKLLLRDASSRLKKPLVDDMRCSTGDTGNTNSHPGAACADARGGHTRIQPYIAHIGGDLSIQDHDFLKANCEKWDDLRRGQI